MGKTASARSLWILMLLHLEEVGDGESGPAVEATWAEVAQAIRPEPLERWRDYLLAREPGRTYRLIEIPQEAADD